MQTPRFTCLFAASFMAITPVTPQQFLALAKERISVAEKISILKRATQSYPDESHARTVRDQLVNLLISTNRYEEAFQEYRKTYPDTRDAIDFKFLELLLRTGRYADLLKNTTLSNPKEDLLRDMKLLELRVQALLATGRFAAARRSVDNWLARYEAEGTPGSRFEGDVQSLRFLSRHLATLERLDGPTGKSLFTASVPDSLQHWSHRRDVPIVFFKLIPAHPAGQILQSMLPGRHETDSYFQERIVDLNRGFAYISRGEFSLKFAGLHTLYIKEGDLDPESSGAHLLTSRVYVHTIPQLYKLAGEALVVLIDYREPADGEAAYMGDGLIHLSASKLQTFILMHEILHGLGATHQEWNSLMAQGYKFDPEDRGLMTFDHGQILDLGLEEKNRALLGWPQVGVVRPRFASDAEVVQAEEEEPTGKSVNNDEEEAEETATAMAPRSLSKSAELIPAL